MELDGKKVFTLFAEQYNEPITAEMLAVFQDICENHLSEILSDCLELPACMESIISSKLLFLRKCLEDGWIKKIVEASSTPEDFGFIEGYMASLIGRAEGMMGDINEIIAKHGVSQEQILVRLGVSDENRMKIASRELTICEILMSQPVIILKSS